MFDLNEQAVTFANFNARTELNGETRKPASDISCRAQLPNKVLDMFYPGLLGMLYERPKNPDLVEQGSAEGFTALRMPLLGLPLDWDLVLDNRTLTIHYGLGDDKSNLVLPECKVHKFKITPQNGGTVLVAWQISAHPDAKQAGWLYDHQTTEIVISLEEVKAADPQAELPLKKSKSQKKADALAEAEAAFVATGDQTKAKKVLAPAAAWPFPTGN
jgi:hypothetical protein